MPTTLALSAYPGDAVFGVGALLAALPDEKHHLTVFAAEEVAVGSGAEAAALKALGATHAYLGLPGDTAASAIESALAPHLERLRPEAVLLPLPLATRPGEGLLARALHALRDAAPATRFLAYYPLPYVNRHRTLFPELAFARPIRGIAEADGDAGTLQWKPRGAAAADGPLATKLAALAPLSAELTRRLSPDPATPPPTNPGALSEALRRAIGTREWLQLA